MLFTCLSGAVVDFKDAQSIQASRVELTDITQGLAKVNRFAGQTREPLSVAQHSILVARLMCATDLTVGLSERAKAELFLVGLLHDAHEAFTSDIPMPAKDFIANSYVQAMEDGLDVMIRTSLGVPELPHWKEARKRADAKARELEIAQFAGITSTALGPLLPWKEAESAYREALCGALAHYKYLRDLLKSGASSELDRVSAQLSQSCAANLRLHALAHQLGEALVRAREDADYLRKQLADLYRGKGV